MSPEPEDLISFMRRKQKSYRAKRRKWLIDCQWPWPEVEKPEPGTQRRLPSGGRDFTMTADQVEALRLAYSQARKLWREAINWPAPGDRNPSQ